MAFTNWKATPFCFFRACRHSGHSMHFRALVFSLSVIVSPFMDCCDQAIFLPGISLVVWPPLLRPGGLGGTRRKHRPGFQLATKNPARFRRRMRGGSSPPHLRRNQRLMIPSGPPRPPGHGFTRPLGFTSFQRAKLLPSPLMVALFNPGSGAFSGSARSCAQS